MDSVLVAENGGSLRDYLQGKINKWWEKDRPTITIDEMFGQMLECHVNYLPLGWGLADCKALEEQRPDLLKKLDQRHIELIDILIRDISFDPQYEKKILDKKLADQDVELNKSQAIAAEKKGITRVIQEVVTADGPQ